jgi:peptide/nickel transport system permease protein
LQLIPVLFGITIVTFFLLRLIPGDPALQILGQHYTKAGAIEVRHSLGLDEPLWRQYLLFLQHLFQGNLGESITYKQSTRTVIDERLPPTLFLVAYAATLALIISVPAGVVSALRRGGVFDQGARVTTLVGFSMPPFWLGIILILIFSIHLQIFPVNGYGTTFTSHLVHLFLPSLTIALGFSTILIRTLRSSTLAVLSSDYVDTARVKGISRLNVLRRHVLRNAIISVVVVFGINLAYLISGTVIIETVFGIPGVGSLLVDSVSTRDYPVVQGVTLVFAVLVVAINLVTDVVHASLDPRVVLE